MKYFFYYLRTQEVISYLVDFFTVTHLKVGDFDLKYFIFLTKV